MMSETVRTHVVLPKKLVDEIDALVGKRKRSEFIAESLEETVRKAAFAAAIRAVREVPGPEVPGWETPEAANEWVRRQRRLVGEGERWLEENWTAGSNPGSPK